MSRKQNFLFVLPMLPYPMESGGHQALHNSIAAVMDDFNVFIVYEAQDTEEYRKAFDEISRKWHTVTFLPLLSKPHVETLEKKIIRYGKKLLKIITRSGNRKPNEADTRIRSLTEWWKYTVTPDNRLWLKHIHNICVNYHIDIVQIEMPWIISDVLAIPSGIRKIYVHHELGFVRRKQEIEAIKEDIYAEVCRRFADMNEIALLNLYDMVITLSPVDAEKMKNMGVKVPIFPSFAVIDSPIQIKEDKGNGKRLTFIGPEIHNPNFVGITWFLDNCWGMLKKKCPEMQLDIIGNWSESRKDEYIAKYEDISFLGFVDNLEASVKDSTLIVPITIGSGIRMKILEASSKGIPFVSTSVGAEGIPLVSGEDCYIADSPEDFVNAVLDLQDSKIRNKFIKNANRMVREHFSLSSLRENRLNIYKNICKQSKIGS